MDVTIHLLPKQPDQFIVCNKSNTIAIMNMQGRYYDSIATKISLIHTVWHENLTVIKFYGFSKLLS